MRQGPRGSRTGRWCGTSGAAGGGRPASIARRLSPASARGSPSLSSDPCGDARQSPRLAMRPLAAHREPAAMQRQTKAAGRSARRATGSEEQQERAGCLLDRKRCLLARTAFEGARVRLDSWGGWSETRCSRAHVQKLCNFHQDWIKPHVQPMPCGPGRRGEARHLGQRWPCGKSWRVNIPRVRRTVLARRARAVAHAGLWRCSGGANAEASMRWSRTLTVP